jgi:hypothetical protein
MEDEDDHHWQLVQGRHRKTKGNFSLLPDIATAGGVRKDYSKLTTYFFSDFPNYFGAKAMFNAFSYYGDIVEVVIPVKRDKGGRRFGFARFDRVRDVRPLEKELDTIIVGRDKISVNLSRFHRSATTWRPVTNSNDAEGHRRSGYRNGEQIGQRSVILNDNQLNQYQKANEQTYATTVRQGKAMKQDNTQQRVIVSF